ncbi:MULTISPECIES: hypothetical protein [unclassified Endozoicomonas]|uniref:hypothetical protein n=3 Tax=Endozoicomonas TaxID=305899 RepID=UPI00214907F7|nr:MULTISPECIES: hypothetical protein [unclassified Endozoicomonas]
MTEHFIVEFEQKANSSSQSISIKRGRLTFPGTPPDITNTSGNAGTDSPPDVKSQRPGGYGVRTTLTESILRQLIYATHLLVGYELSLTTKESPLCLIPYSWFPLEAVVAVGWLLKNHWKPISSFLNTIEQQETSQDKPFAIITMVHGSGHDQQKDQTSELSGLQAPATNIHPTGSFTALLYSGSGGGIGGPQEHSHTLDLNCFVHPCRGVCQFRPSSGSRKLAKWSLNSAESSTGVTPGQGSRPHPFDGDCFLYSSHAYPLYPRYSQDPLSTVGAFTMDTSGPLYLPDLQEGDGISSNSDTLIHPFWTSETQTTTEPSQFGQSQPHLSQTAPVQASGATKNVMFGSTDRQQTLLDCKSNCNSKQKTCTLIVVGEKGQTRLCGKTCKNSGALADHRRKDHSGRLICQFTMVGKDGQRQLCGITFKNALSLSSHKSRIHSGQRTCVDNVVGKDGKPRPCGMVCKNAGTLTDHKRREHSGQQICVKTVIGADGVMHPCDTVCSSSRALSDHKRKDHTERQVCKVAVFGEDGLLRRCGKVYRNAQALSDHKRSNHTSQQTCDVKVVGVDGKQWPCGKVCKNSRALTDHRKIHRKRKLCGVNKDSDHSPQKESVSNN